MVKLLLKCYFFKFSRNFITNKKRKQVTADLEYQQKLVFPSLMKKKRQVRHLVTFFLNQVAIWLKF